MKLFSLFHIKEAIKVVQPLLLGKIILYFENYDPGDQRSLWMVYGYAAAMSLSTFGADYPPTSLLLPCPKNRHEDQSGHVSHDIQEGQWRFLQGWLQIFSLLEMFQ